LPLNSKRGRGGIRTHGNLAITAVFKTASINHSDTLPVVERGDGIASQSASREFYGTALRAFHARLREGSGLVEIEREASNRAFVVHTDELDAVVLPEVEVGGDVELQVAAGRGDATVLNECAVDVGVKRAVHVLDEEDGLVGVVLRHVDGAPE
jgi:hypothetical protein